MPVSEVLVWTQFSRDLMFFPALERQKLVAAEKRKEKEDESSNSEDESKVSFFDHYEVCSLFVAPLIRILYAVSCQNIYFFCV